MSQLVFKVESFTMFVGYFYVVPGVFTLAQEICQLLFWHPILNHAFHHINFKVKGGMAYCKQALQWNQYNILNI
jgi:hypothetical protein